MRASYRDAIIIVSSMGCCTKDGIEEDKFCCKRKEKKHVKNDRNWNICCNSIYCCLEEILKQGRIMITKERKKIMPKESHWSKKKDHELWLGHELEQRC